MKEPSYKDIPQEFQSPPSISADELKQVTETITSAAEKAGSDLTAAAEAAKMELEEAAKHAKKEIENLSSIELGQTTIVT